MSTIYLIGDSTVDDNTPPFRGWGFALPSFVREGVRVCNHALSGCSTRSFWEQNLFAPVYEAMQPGDLLMIQFGHNDICSVTDPKERGVIASTKDTCHVYKMEADGSYEMAYSFGWYLKKFIDDVREKGATPILLSLTPRNEWPNGRIERRNDTYGRWYREVVEQTGVAFVDIHNISGDFLDKKFASGQEIDAELLVKAGLIRAGGVPVKVLAKGELHKPLTVKASAFSKGAAAKIEAAGGKAEVV